MNAGGDWLFTAGPGLRLGLLGGCALLLAGLVALALTADRPAIAMAAAQPQVSAATQPVTISLHCAGSRSGTWTVLLDGQMITPSTSTSTSTSPAAWQGSAAFRLGRGSILSVQYLDDDLLSAHPLAVRVQLNGTDVQFDQTRWGEGSVALNLPLDALLAGPQP